MRKLILLLILALPLVAATGDVVAVRVIQNTCTAGASCNGWVAEIDLEGLSTGGTYDFGLGANNNPSTAKIVFTVTSPGYTTSGGSTTIQRTVYGTVALRKPYPNEASKDETAGTPLTVRVALSDFIYSGDTATVSIASGFYAGSNAVTDLAVTNNSTLTHPKPIGRWAWVPYERVAGDFLLEFVAFHRSARNGKPLAAVTFTCQDENTNTVTATVTDMTVSTRTGDANKVLVYAATIPVSTLTQGDVVTCNAVAYPWVGDVTLNSDLVANGGDGYAQPDERLGPYSVLLDKAGTYGAAYAVVDATNGQASTAATWVYSSQAAAEAAYASNNTNSYSNIGRAASAIKAYNNTNYSRNEPGGGVILLAAGNHTYPGTAPGTSLGAQKEWLTITHHSAVAREDAVINALSSTLKADKSKMQDISITSANSLAGRTTDTLWVDRVAINNTNTNTNIQSWLVAYATHNPIESMSKGFTYFGTTRCAWALLRGNSYTQSSPGAGIVATAYNVLGNKNLAPRVWIETGASTGQALSDNVVVAYNTAYNFNGDWINGPATSQMTHGAAVVQNVVETVTNVRSVGFAEAAAVTLADNLMMWHNTMLANGANLLYNDSGETALTKRGTFVGNIYDRFASKTDTFTTANGARTGNWSVTHQVGSYGNRSGNATFPVDFYGLYAGSFGFAAGTDNLLYVTKAAHTSASGNRPITGASYGDYWTRIGNPPVTWSWQTSTAYTPFTFVSDKSLVSGDAGGNGDYRLVSGSGALSLIPANMAVLPYDLNGVARKNDGTGAAGAYEYSAGGRRKLTIIQ